MNAPERAVSAPNPADAAVEYPDVRLLVGGVWRDGADGGSLPVLNPANGAEIGRVAVATIADLDAAAQAAQRGFEAWRKVPAVERAKLMRRAAALFRERAEQTARWLTLEQGKTLPEARAEIAAAADIVEWFADEGLRVSGRLVQPRAANVQAQVRKEPVGPVAAFTPWNFPVNQAVRKVSAALATGCSIVLKAPEETPASPAALVRAFHDAGLPEGVVNLVFGDPATISGHLIPHPAIRKISFTGSTAVGKQLAALAGLHMKRATMELGGHAPVIVTADADVAAAARILAGTKFRNAGQICVSPTRFLVHASIKDAFTEAFVAHVAKVRPGDGLAEGSTMGPLAHERRVHALQAFADDARARGAQVLAGGARIGEAGYFFAPTVVLDPPMDSKLLNEEPFGPIAAIRGFDTLEEAIAEGNRLPYGLAGYAFTQSLRTAHQLSAEMQVGMLWINQPNPAWPELPFGGVKDSGIGSEGGPEALDAYLVTKTVTIAT